MNLVHVGIAFALCLLVVLLGVWLVAPLLAALSGLLVGLGIGLAGAVVFWSALFALAVLD